jgi:hypothetical protein
LMRKKGDTYSEMECPALVFGRPPYHLGSGPATIAK